MTETDVLTLSAQMMSPQPTKLGARSMSIVFFLPKKSTIQPTSGAPTIAPIAVIEPIHARSSSEIMNPYCPFSSNGFAGEDHPKTDPVMQPPSVTENII